MATSEPEITTLAELVEISAQVPVEGLLEITTRVAQQVRESKSSLSITADAVSGLYSRLDDYTKHDDSRGERASRAFAYLFRAAEDTTHAEGCFEEWIGLLEKRGVYGMAGDAAMEAGRRSQAVTLYETQIRKMDVERRENGEMNEAYYDEMLFKAGKIDLLNPRVLKTAEYFAERGWFAQAAEKYETIGMTAEAEKYARIAAVVGSE